MILTLADTKYLGATAGANTLSRRASVLEGNRIGIFNLYFLPALHAICLHFRTSLIILPSSVANPPVFVNSYKPENGTIS